MSEILNEELGLLVKGLLHLERRVAILLPEAGGVKELHLRAERLTGLLLFLPFRWSDSIIASAVSNGP